MKAVEVDYRVVPLPQEVSVSPGGFALGKDVRIVYPEGNEAMKRNAGYLAGYLREATGTSYRTEAGGGRKGDIILRLESGDGLPEAYTLKVDGDGIVISGTGEAGVFYGIQTLRKSIPAVAGASFGAACRGGEGRPAFRLPWRAFRREPPFLHRGRGQDIH